MKPILHITDRPVWERALASGNYHPDSLLSEGFIHCSDPEQVVETGNRFFQGQENKILLVIDPALVNCPIKYEGTGGACFFPHIYGPLNTSAVVKVLDFTLDKSGRFVLPDIS